MHASVRFRDHLGAAHELVHGDLIGRLWSASLQLNDGRVSEAHAMVSLREGELRLLGLRGAFAIDGRPMTDVALEAGQRVQIARGLELVVESVALPDRVLGLEGPGLVRQALPAVCSVLADPSPRLSRGWKEGALWSIWSTGDGWVARDHAGAERIVTAGDALALGETTLTLVDIPLRNAGPPATRRGGEFDAPLTVVARFDTVDIERGEENAVRLSGKAARLVSELVAVPGVLLRLDPRGDVVQRTPFDGTAVELTVSTDLRWAALGLLDGTALVIRVADGELVARLLAHTGRVSALVFADHDRWRYTGAWDATARRWSTRAFEADPDALRAEVNDRWGLELDEVLSDAR